MIDCLSSPRAQPTTIVSSRSPLPSSLKAFGTAFARLSLMVLDIDFGREVEGALSSRDGTSSQGDSRTLGASTARASGCEPFDIGGRVSSSTVWASSGFQPRMPEGLAVLLFKPPSSQGIGISHDPTTSTLKRVQCSRIPAIERCVRDSFQGARRARWGITR